MRRTKPSSSRVIATGESHTLEEFVALAFAAFDLDWKEHVDVDPALFRPSDIAYSRGNPEKSRRVLGWAAKTKFRELVGNLADAERAYREALLLQPHHIRAKWNLELVNRLRGAGGQANKPNPPPPPSPGKGGGGGAGQQQQPAGANNNASGGLSEDQADQVLRSIGQEELRTRRDQTGRSRRAAPAGIKDW